MPLHSRGWQPRTSVLAGLIVLSLSRLNAQDHPDGFSPAVAVPKAWALLTSAIEGGTPQDQAAAVLALAAAGTLRARDVVERVARDGPGPARSVAIRSLPNADSRYLPLLADALQDEDVEVRRSALDLLGSIRDPGTLALLQPVILEGDDDTIEWAVSCARRLGPLAFNALLRGWTRENSGSMNPRSAVLRGFCRTARHPDSPTTSKRFGSYTPTPFSSERSWTTTPASVCSRR